MDNLITMKDSSIYAIIGREEIRSEPFNGVVEFDNVSKFPPELVFISMADPKKPFIKTDDYFQEEIKLRFWDVEEEIGQYCPIHTAQAKKIYDFIIKNKDKQFLINCEAGVSRSAGVGLAIEYLLRDKYLFPKWEHYPSKVLAHRRYDPNMTVFNTIVSHEKMKESSKDKE